MTEGRYDAVIVGAGHNGLVCAAYLAKAGRRVLVLEANARVGGAARTREFHDGFSVSCGAHYLSLLNPAVARDLKLREHGLQYAARDLATIALDAGGDHVTLSGGAASGERLPRADREAWDAFHARMLRFARVLAGACGRKPPKLADTGLRDSLSLARLGWDIRTLGARDMSEFLRIALMNIYDLANEHFSDELLKAALSVDGVLGSHMGPRSPGTVLGYLYRSMGEVFGFRGPALPAGGMGAVGEALAASARALGVEIRTSTPVSRIVLSAGRVAGVTLAGGESIECGTVVSNADPKTTFETLVGYPNVETGFARRIHNIRMRGTAAKLHLALDGLPRFTGLDAAGTGSRLLIAPGMDAVEDAFNSVKYGEFSPKPIMEISVPSVHDEGAAPAGKHVLSAVIQYAPHEPDRGWENCREPFAAAIMDRLEAYAPGIRDQVVFSELLTPADIERYFLIRGGHWHHGELAIDQFLFTRPVPGHARYGTPVDGLYLCGAGAHPGGGVMGLAGANAARAVIGEGK